MNRRAPALEPAANMEQTGGIASAHRIRAGLLDAPELVGQHRGGDVGIPDREQPSEAAALGRVAEGPELEAAHGAQQGLGPVTESKRPERVARGVVRHGSRMAGAHVDGVRRLSER